MKNKGLPKEQKIHFSNVFFGLGYYFITDANLSRKGNISDVKTAIAAGVKFIQYRNKETNTKLLYEEALKLRKICKNAKFIINDRVDIALAVGADGVHLGREDLPYKIARKLLGKKRIIGLTVHNLKDALDAQKIGANYLGVSPIFSTATKKDAGLPCGIEFVKKIKKQIHIPIVAIGGINLSNVRQVINAGADAICAISAVVTAPNVRGKIEEFQKLFG
ncbi:MAG: thiamine phosphate synthase [Candidatus Omnitrophota bacterium]|nr:thiamine phosphate synthase [Candidatus Omnitrophota bacterium]